MGLLLISNESHARLYPPLASTVAFNNIYNSHNWTVYDMDESQMHYGSSALTYRHKYECNELEISAEL